MGKDVGVGGITGSHRCGVQEEGRDVGVYEEGTGVDVEEKGIHVGFMRKAQHDRGRTLYPRWT